MGYVSKDIAVITEPDIVTLSGTPNFVQFESKPAEKIYLEVNLWVKLNAETPDGAKVSLLKITDAGGGVHEYAGTTDPADVGGSVFFIASDSSDTAENLRQALLADSWFSSSFEVVIPFLWADGIPANGDRLVIKSKGAGIDFNIDITKPYDTDNRAYSVIWISQTSRNNDSITGEASSVQIDLDVYADPDTFLGQDDRPLTSAKLGRYLVTLSKTYAGLPIWFELNALFSRYGGYSLPKGYPGWFNTDTAGIYRFTAKVRSVNSFYFYQSNALFVLNGYGPATERADLSPYIYEDGSAVKLLSNKPLTPYVRGQREYLNFIFRDPMRGSSTDNDYTLSIIYRAYSTSGAQLGRVEAHPQSRRGFALVNTCELDIDAILDKHPQTAIVRVGLMRDGETVSNELEYRVLPECLHTLRQFSFLNRLGGWDSFNFDAGLIEEIKPSYDTYNKTVTPAYHRGDSIETVYKTDLENTFTVEGAPVTDEVADWLKELAAAIVILDGEGNRIIVEDFTLQKSDSNRNMQQPTIKYRLSESYTND